MQPQSNPNHDAVSTRDARTRFSELLGRTEYAKERIQLTRHGKVIAYLVPPEDVESLQRTEAEDYRQMLADIRDGMEELAQGKGIPLDTVQVELSKRRQARLAGHNTGP